MNSRRTIIICAIIIFILSGYMFKYLTQYKKLSYLMEGTYLQTSVHRIKGKKSGKKIVIIGGIHGNEIAGIKAAEELRNLSLKRGQFAIIPKANIEACTAGERMPYYMSDLNRAFPGRVNGTDSEKLAYDIYNFIMKEKPDLVIDMHEWERRFDEDNSILANGIILNEVENFQEIIFELIENLSSGLDERNKLTYYGSSPEGSLNREVWERLQIPVITVESNMENNLEYRIKLHTDIVKFFIKSYGMDD